MAENRPRRGYTGDVRNFDQSRYDRQSYRRDGDFGAPRRGYRDEGYGGRGDERDMRGRQPRDSAYGENEERQQRWASGEGSGGRGHAGMEGGGHGGRRGGRGRYSHVRLEGPRVTGFVATVRDGFGFINCVENDERVFFHFSEFEGDAHGLDVNAEVEFGLGENKQTGNLNALEIRLLPPGSISIERVSEERFKGFVEVEVGKGPRGYSGRGGPRPGRGEEVGYIVVLPDGKVVETERAEGVDEEKADIAPRQHRTQEGKGRFAFSRRDVENSEQLKSGDVVEFAVLTHKRTGRERCGLIKLIERAPEEHCTGFVCSLKSSFGFVDCCEVKREVFFHFSEVVNEDIFPERDILLGTEVEYVVRKEFRTNKLCAYDVRVLPRGSVSFDRILGERQFGVVVSPPKRRRPDRESGAPSELPGQIRLAGEPSSKTNHLAKGIENTNPEEEKTVEPDVLVPFGGWDFDGMMLPGGLRAGDDVSFLLAQEKRTGDRHATDIVMVRPSDEPREQGVVIQAREERGYVEGCSRTQELFFFLDDMLPKSFVEEAKDTHKPLDVKAEIELESVEAQGTEKHPVLFHDVRLDDDDDRPLRVGDEVEFVVDEPPIRGRGRNVSHSQALLRAMRLMLLPRNTVSFETVVPDELRGIVVQEVNPAAQSGGRLKSRILARDVPSPVVIDTRAAGMIELDNPVNIGTPPDFSLTVRNVGAESGDDDEVAGLEEDREEGGEGSKEDKPLVDETVDENADESKQRDKPRRRRDLRSLYFTLSDVLATEANPNAGPLRVGDIVQFRVAVSKQHGKARAAELRLLERPPEKREQGVVVTLKGDYGFIDWKDPEHQVYFHISQFVPASVEEGEAAPGEDDASFPVVGSCVEFTVTKERSRKSPTALRVHLLPPGSVSFDTVSEVKHHGFVLREVSRGKPGWVEVATEDSGAPDVQFSGDIAHHAEAQPGVKEEGASPPSTAAGQPAEESLDKAPSDNGQIPMWASDVIGGPRNLLICDDQVEFYVATDTRTGRRRAIKIVRLPERGAVVYCGKSRRDRDWSSGGKQLVIRSFNPKRSRDDILFEQGDVVQNEEATSEGDDKVVLKEGDEVTFELEPAGSASGPLRASQIVREKEAYKSVVFSSQPPSERRKMFTVRAREVIPEVRQPLGPDGTRGFAAGRGRGVARDTPPLVEEPSVVVSAADVGSLDNAPSE